MKCDNQSFWTDEDLNMLRSLSDGSKNASQIAEHFPGRNPVKVAKKIRELNLPRMKAGAPVANRNPSWIGGRAVDLDGYILVRAPLGHPHARVPKGKRYGLILEHRLVMERTIGRYLDPQEVVDHIDGCKINNHPDNLRLFQTNADHLKMTISGQVPDWSKEGFANIGFQREGRLLRDHERVDTYHRDRVRGEIRRRQILLARELLGKDHPFLAGTERYLSRKKT